MKGKIFSAAHRLAHVARAGEHHSHHRRPEQGDVDAQAGDPQPQEDHGAQDRHVGGHGDPGGGQETQGRQGADAAHRQQGAQDERAGVGGHGDDEGGSDEIGRASCRERV